MHIEADLDEIHGERLADLQLRLQKPLSEVLATVIDWAWSQTPQAPDALPEPLSVGQWQTLDLSRDSLYNDDGR